MDEVGQSATAIKQTISRTADRANALFINFSPVWRGPTQIAVRAKFVVVGYFESLVIQRLVDLKMLVLWVYVLTSQISPHKNYLLRGRLSVGILQLVDYEVFGLAFPAMRLCHFFESRRNPTARFNSLRVTHVASPYAALSALRSYGGFPGIFLASTPLL